MKALVKREKGEGFVEIMECEKPVPKNDEVLIRVAYTGICGTDIHILHDQFSYWPPVIMGHEFSGIVEETGSNVTSFKVGDRVVGEPHNKACGKCHLCRNGKIQICDQKRSIGWGIDGAFAPYLVMPEKLLHKVSDNISLKAAAVAEPCAIVAHQMLERTGICAGDYVVVMGMGAIALIAAQMAKAAGASRVVMCGCDCDTGIRPIIIQLVIQLQQRLLKAEKRISRCFCMEILLLQSAEKQKRNSAVSLYIHWSLKEQESL